MKNRYCRNTKLSEEEFLSILAAYCSRTTASEAATTSPAHKKPASRQTVERIFLQLGDYLYRKYVSPIFVELARRNPKLSDVTESERVILDGLWQAMRGELDYEYFRRHKLPFPGGDALLLVLKNRWTMLNGFTRDKFPHHVAYAIYQLEDDEPLSFMATVRIHERLKEMLEKDPL